MGSLVVSIRRRAMGWLRKRRTPVIRGPLVSIVPVVVLRISSVLVLIVISVVPAALGMLIIASAEVSRRRRRRQAVAWRWSV